VQTNDSLTEKKAKHMHEHQGNELAGYVFWDGRNFRICLDGAVRNSITKEEMGKIMRGDV